MRLSIISALVGAAAVSAISTISQVGNKFFTGDGNQFFMKGIAYQLSPDDPLLDAQQCARDASLMKTLGTNVIRVYHVNATGNHDGCMSEFEKVGIYVLIDLDTFDSYILKGTTPTWTKDQYNAYAAVMDTFHGYDNTLGFFVGNEVINAKGQSMAAPYIKAAARDMKAYRDSKGYRTIPIGYSAADIAQLRPMLQNYLTCGGNASENIDFFGLNSYEWCGPVTYQSSGYANLEAEAKDFPVPIFFSETGCIKPRPRTFADQSAIFGPNMVHDWSGAIIYEWIQEQNDYGLIAYGDPTANFARSGTPTPIQPDWDNLSSQWATLSPTGVNGRTYNPSSVSTRPCPTPTNGGWWEIDGNVKLPTVGQAFTGTYSTAATVNPASVDTPTPSFTSGTATGSAAQASQTKDNAGSNKMVGVSAGLVGVTLLVTLLL